MTAFLFTDIEGSTSLWERHPGVMRTAHRRQRDVIESAIAAEGGRVVKDTGDGVFAVFDDPDGALASAIDAQVELASLDWGLIGDLRVRMGLHVGHADVVDDGDLHGRAPNRGARVMAAGHGGQILASAEFVGAVTDRRGADMVSLGRHRLKGIDEPTELFQIGVSGLESEFPPLRTLDGLPNNLPKALSRFVGRQEATDALVHVLEDKRLVTLVGAGGAGKTRLALHVATELLERFADGAWFVDLAGVGEDELVAPTVAGSLGIADQPGRDWLDSIARFVADRELLVVFDNCEHLLDSVAEVVAKLLAASPGSKVIATSREILNVPGEQGWPVSSLSVADPSDSVDKLRESEAVALFLDRAASAQPGFDPSDIELRSIVDICRRLDGLPLAIELAAARVRLLPVSEIASRLDDRFSLLVGGSRTALARQRTLEATVAWSYQLLDPDERSVFARLSIFPGSFSLDAAARMCADLDTPVLGGVGALVDRSLLEPVPESDGARYRMLETLRMFGRDRLIDLGEMETARERLVEWVADLADEAEPEMNGPSQLKWHGILDAEIDTIRAAMQWSVDRRDSATAVSIAGALHRYWFDRSPREGRTWLSRALDLDVADVPDDRLARAEIAYGHILQVLGDNHGTIDWCRQASERASQSGEPARVGWAEHYLCRGLWGLDRLQDALDAAKSSMAQLEAAGDPIGVLLSGMYVALLSLLSNERDDAIAILPVLDRLSASVASPALQAHTHETAAGVHGFGGDLDRGRPHIRRAMEDYRRLGEHPCLGHALTTAAFFTTDGAACEAAALLHGKSLAIWEEGGLVVPPWERIANRRVEEYCTATWPPEELADLYAKGGSLTIDEAIDLALDSTINSS